jgi:chitodextrinase
VLLCLSSTALASRPSGHEASPSVSFPYRVTSAERLTLQVGRLATALGHRTMPAAQRRELRRRLVALSKERVRAVARLAAHKPDLALRWRLSPSVRAVLRRLRGGAFERRVTMSGRYRYVAGETGSKPQLVSANGKHVVTLRAVELPELAPDAPISVTGYRVRRVVLVPRGGIHQPSSTTHAASALSTTVGTINTAVIVGTFSDSTSTVDMQKIQNVFGGNPGHDVDSFFSEASYGKMTLAPQFYGPFTLPETTAAGCNSGTLQQDIVNAAGTSLDFLQVRRLVVVANCPRTFGYSTSEGPVSTPAGVITAAVTLLDPSSAYQTYFVAHEISHTLGTGNKHAAYYACLPSQFIAPTRFDRGCASDEYGDWFDILGGGPANLISQQDPYHKANAGWFTNANYPTVTTPGTSTYTLSPYELSSDGPLALNIPRGNSGTSFTVEYRQPVGFDSWMGTKCPACNVTQGASLRLVSSSYGGGGGSDTQLIDTTPGSIPSTYYYPVDDAQDAALTPGRTFTDPEYGISIKTVSSDSSGLTVQVTIPQQTCTRAAPTVSAVSPSSQAVAYGQTATYSFTLTNNDSSGCPSNTFRYFSPGTAGLSFVANPDYLTLAPGAAATVSLAISAQASTTAGTWNFTSLDGRGGGYIYSDSLGTGAAVASSFSFQLTSPTDRTAPSAASALNAQALGSGAVKLSWQPSSDNVGVAGYSLTSSQGYMYTTTGTTFVDPDVSASSAYTVTVQAFDRAGNYSLPAIVPVTTPAKSDLTRPTAPIVSASATDHTVTVSWSGSTDDTGVAYYRISPCLVLNCVVPAGVHSFTASGLTTRTELDLQVMAYDGDGNYSDRSLGKDTVFTGVQGSTPPSQPQRFVSTAGSYHSVALSWAASSDPTGVAGYYVYRNGQPIATVTGTSYTDTGAGGSGQYYVQAFDAAGSLSSPSTAIWFLPPLSSSSDSTPPTSAITAPADGATVSGTVPVSATASDDVAVTRVELYVDGVLKQTDTTAPYTFNWDSATVGDGSHWLYVLARDAAGNYGTVGGAMVTVNNSGGDPLPPSVAIDAPTDGATVSGPVTISADASDDSGVAVVNIAVDGSHLCTDSAAPYNCPWDPTTAGDHTIQATAVDDSGNSASASVDVTVASAPTPDMTPPAVSFSSPAGGATLSGKTTVQANASDDTGVASVSFAIDGTTVLTDSSAPWTFSVDTTKLANGTHTLAVTAGDAAGNSSSAQENITVQNATDTKAPSTPSGLKLAVAGTTAGAIYWSPSTDNVGVAGYYVYRDGVRVAQTTLPNYLDIGLAPGTSHAYTVKAFDAAGNVSASTAKLSVKTAALSTATTSTVAGVVYGSTGKPAASVVVTLSGNGLTKTAKTNTSGVYKFSTVPAGTYTIAVSSSNTSVTAVAGQTVLVVGPS